MNIHVSWIEWKIFMVNIYRDSHSLDKEGWLTFDEDEQTRVKPRKKNRDNIMERRMNLVD